MLKRLTRKVIAFSHYLGSDALLDIEDIDALSVEKKVAFYTLGWGKYLDVFFNSTLPSILHNSNAPRLQKDGFELSFILYTIDSVEEIKRKYSRQIDQISPHKFSIVPFNSDNKKRSIVAHKSILKILKHCVDNNLIMFMAPPDTVFSNDSVYNSISFAYLKRKSFAAAHPRVSTNFVDHYREFPKDGFKSPEMVAYALNNSHPNFEYADEELSFSTVHAGISYRKISKSLYAVTSNMPSPYVVIPTSEDIVFFEESGTFNDWDRGWLSLLLKKNRVKISGSSDMFFCMELTEDRDNAIVQPKKVKSPWNDLYFKAFEKRISNIFVSIWRV